MGRLWALTFTPVILMTFEFCQRGATVDTPFLTVLKTWTSPLEHSVIIHVCVRLEFPEFSTRAPCLRTSGLDRLCLVLHQTLVFCLGRAGNALWGIPTHHRLGLEATGWLEFPSALYCAGRHSFVPVGTQFCQNDIFCRPGTVHLLSEIFSDSCVPLASPPYTCMEGWALGCLACKSYKFYKRKALLLGLGLDFLRGFQPF